MRFYFWQNESHHDNEFEQNSGMRDGVEKTKTPRKKIRKKPYDVRNAHTLRKLRCRFQMHRLTGRNNVEALQLNSLEIETHFRYKCCGTVAKENCETEENDVYE